MNRHNDPLLRACHEQLESSGGGPATVEAFAPGRIELFGKHTDYAGGSSLVAAADRGFRMAARPRDDGLIRMVPADAPDDTRTFQPGEAPTLPPGHWLNYPATTARRIALNFRETATLSGADIVFLSDLPKADGMSSSSAFMVATFLLLARLNRLEDSEPWLANIHSDETLAEYLGCIENGASYGTLAGETGVGTFGGSEDHTAMLCSRAGQLGLFRYAPIRLLERLTWDDSCHLVIATSGVTAEKTGSALHSYNRASLRAALIVEVLNRVTGAGFGNLLECTEFAKATGLTEVSEMLTAAERDDDRLRNMRLLTRFEQFYHEEFKYVPEAATAFRTGELNQLGMLSDASHEGAARGLENQIPQTDALQRLARREGALAASAFGAGFGGSVWALVPAASATGFEEAWTGSYTQAYPAEATGSLTLVMRPSGPAWVRSIE